MANITNADRINPSADLTQEAYNLIDLNHEFDLEAMQFNAEQAQLNRDFQERMSNTAHQREVQDLIAAGLNPVLSAKLGGASSPTGSTATGSNSGSGVISSVFNTIINSAVNLASQMSQRQNVLDQVAGNIKVAGIQGQTSRDVALINAESVQRVESMKEEAEKYIKENYPQSEWTWLKNFIDNYFFDNTGYPAGGIDKLIDDYVASQNKFWNRSGDNAITRDRNYDPYFLGNS